MDVRIQKGRIVEIGRGLVGGRIVDVKDLWVVPGLIDLHVHLREPGQTAKETVATGTLAAARGRPRGVRAAAAAGATVIVLARVSSARFRRPTPARTRPSAHDGQPR